MPSMIYLMLRGARKARLEARTDVDAAFQARVARSAVTGRRHDSPIQTYG